MSVLVDVYDLLEKDASKARMCHECTFVPVWQVKEHLAAKPKVGYACGQHIDTVLYLVESGLIGPPNNGVTNGEVE